MGTEEKHWNNAMEVSLGKVKVCTHMYECICVYTYATSTKWGRP